MSKIKELRKSRGMTQADLATALHVHQTAVSQWETGRTAPDIDQYSKLAELFDTSVDDIMGRAASYRSHITTKIPVLGRVAAGIPIEAITDIEDYEEIPEDMAALGEYAALRIHGDSMEPRMCDGDVVIVRIQPDVNSGDTAIVLVNGSDATCKKIKKTPEGVMLIPGNPAYEPTFYTNKQIAELPVTIFGKVVELRAKY